MKIVIAPDSFKECMTAQAVAEAMAQGVRDVLPNAEIHLKPMADGGEGTMPAIIAALGGEIRLSRVHGPLGHEIEAEWGWHEATRTAVIEMAAASGLHLVPAHQRDVSASSSVGVGELIRAALDAGAQRIMLGLGGSATNDGGKGMLEALGVAFVDAQGATVRPGGIGLSELQSIDTSQLDARLQYTEILVACDVDNVLCGPSGASQVFGPQKGASPEEVAQLELALAHFADQCLGLADTDARDFPGAGAAGGIGFAAKTFLNGRFYAGVELVAELTQLEHSIQGAALVLTGEGKLDRQTLQGKTPMGVATIAQRHAVPVFAIGGSLGEGYQALYARGITAAFSLVPGPVSLAYALEHAPELLRSRTADVMRVWTSGADRV